MVRQTAFRPNPRHKAKKTIQQRQIVIDFLPSSHYSRYGIEKETVTLKITTLLILSAVVAGCNVDMDSIKDCKDKNGEPLPEWVCRKDASSEKNGEP